MPFNIGISDENVVGVRAVLFVGTNNSIALLSVVRNNATIDAMLVSIHAKICAFITEGCAFHVNAESQMELSSIRPGTRYYRYM